jgi:hypothetical protein
MEYRIIRDTKGEYRIQFKMLKLFWVSLSEAEYHTYQHAEDSLKLVIKNDINNPKNRVIKTFTDEDITAWKLKGDI